MRFQELHIANFKAIDQLSVEDLKDVIVIAGPNGCGKSTVFDAIRLWKSAIGPYHKDEFRQWITELGFEEKSRDITNAHQNPGEPFSIRATIALSAGEVESLIKNARAILTFYFYKLQQQGHVMAPPLNAIQNLEVFDDFRSQKEALLARADKALPQIECLRDDPTLTGSVEVDTEGNVAIDAPLALKIILSVYSPSDVGMIDYYGPHRTFGKESVSTVNLNVDVGQDNQRQASLLYNQAGKYSNIKTELASAFIRAKIAQIANPALDSDRKSLDETMAELFATFIPGKKFEGIQPTVSGGFTFNVKTPGGTHDIDGLSSGEKELIYGYLRLRNSGRRDSVILIDEPELHLNPRLTDGLPDFYLRHISRSLNNQLWLVTHSDTILRQSVGYSGFSVYHMQAVGAYQEHEPQIVEVSDEDNLNRAIINLVGDLAAYKPNAKLVILEGGGDAEIDARIVSVLFPEFVSKVNLVSATNKVRVRNLHTVLDQVAKEHGAFQSVYSITDWDGDIDKAVLEQNRLRWDRYHIENYLLEPRYVLQALKEQFLVDASVTEGDVAGMLKEAAEHTQHALIRHAVESFIQRQLRSASQFNLDRSGGFQVEDAVKQVSFVSGKISDVAGSSLSPENLRDIADTEAKRLGEALSSSEWLAAYRGREVLKSFLARHIKKPIRYETFRNSVLHRMRDEQFKPDGMANVLKMISGDSEAEIAEPSKA